MTLLLAEAVAAGNGADFRVEVIAIDALTDLLLQRGPLREEGEARCALHEH